MKSVPELDSLSSPCPISASLHSPFLASPPVSLPNQMWPPLPHYHSSLLGSASTSSDSISLLSLSLSVLFLSPWLAQLPLLMLPRLTTPGNIGAKTKGWNRHVPPSCHSTVGSHLHQEGLALWQDGNTGQSQLLWPAKMPPAAHCESLKPLLKFWKSSMNRHRADFFLCTCNFTDLHGCFTCHWAHPKHERLILSQVSAGCFKAKKYQSYPKKTITLPS